MDPSYFVLGKGAVAAVSPSKEGTSLMSPLGVYFHHENSNLLLHGNHLILEPSERVTTNYCIFATDYL